MLIFLQKSSHTYLNGIPKSSHTYPNGILKSGCPFPNEILKKQLAFPNKNFQKSSQLWFYLSQWAMCSTVFPFLMESLTIWAGLQGGLSDAPQIPAGICSFLWVLEEKILAECSFSHIIINIFYYFSYWMFFSHYSP